MNNTRLPVTVLTGFLGAGKTTLLNRILSEPHGRRYAVIVNEYGEIGIDGALVVGVEDEVYELNNGCLCCKVRGDLIRVLTGLIRRGQPLDGVLIETSGLADPAPVLQTFVLDDLLRQHLVLDSVVCVADARHLPEQAGRDPEAVQQLAQADLVLLSKTDLATAAQVAGAEAVVQQINPTAQLHHATRGDVPLALLLDRGAFDLSRLKLPSVKLATVEGGMPRYAPALAGGGAARHGGEIRSVCLVLEEALDPARFTAWLQTLITRDGAHILRAKGIVALAGQAQRFVFQAVHMTVDTTFGAPWRADEARTSRLVFIVRGLDVAHLDEALQRCRAATAPLVP